MDLIIKWCRKPLSFSLFQFWFRQIKRSDRVSQKTRTEKLKWLGFVKCNQIELIISQLIPQVVVYSS